MSEVEKFLEELAGEVHNRLVKVDRKGKQITLKVKVRRQDAPRETAKFLGMIPPCLWECVRNSWCIRLSIAVIHFKTV